MTELHARPTRLEHINAWIPTSIWLVTLVQTAFLIAFIASDGYDLARTGEEIRVALTYATILALFGIIHLACPNPKWALRATFFMFFIFVTINFLRFETAGSFDYGFVHENIRELQTSLGRRIVFGNVKAIEIIALFVFPLATGLSLIRWPAPPWPGSGWSRCSAMVACVGVLVGSPVAQLSTHESITGFIVSAARFYSLSRETRNFSAQEGDEFPLLHDFVPTARKFGIDASNAPRPHVIMLILESWSGLYQGQARPDGRRFTPVFDEHVADGFSVKHFYGNSVQTSRGHFATLCSIIPMFRGKEFIDIPATNLHCLPQIMRDLGYQTLFDSATDEPMFDQSAKFMTRVGFNEVRFAVDRRRLADPAIWGSGIQDDVFYKRAFNVLDQAANRDPSRPIFAVLANASNHYPFNNAPGHIPDPNYRTKYRRNYVASLSAADAWLTTFFDELAQRQAFKNAIVILVGDHSFPADEHGIHFNGLGSYEESFRTSFMLRWTGHVPTAIETSRAASQIDIAPTLLDLLEVKAQTHFVGTSMFAEKPAPPVSLVQPYDGVRLAAVLWPWKLVRHEASNQEQIYNLANDPDEEQNCIDDPHLVIPRSALHETIVRIFESQSILRENRVWPDH